ncbi:hypothetical protein BDA99DRAFT_494347 [Phascolomyces articulosus]|uniref:F-box domain-containing protein n=1 Tax=Phascolomyces articulosus TaxID=60185 RepID=A0AAD5PIK5_9FUNG|nr:hypothetical protein BDA99DRAFT_494347 [Phascolomyces articulosus]
MLPQLNVLSLTQLTLEQNVKDSLLIEILKKSPKLACLTLPLWSGQKLANILNIIHIHSPYLQSLRYGRIMPRKDVTYSTDHHQKHHSTPISLHHGLKELEIWLAEDTVNTSKQQADMLDQLQALFQQNRNSILIVRLLGGFLSHSSFDLTLLVGQSHHGLPRLKFLELEQTRSNDSKLLADTFRACPSLEHVDFCCTHEHLCNEQAIEALASLKYLRRLSLDIKAKGWQLSDKYVLFHLFKEKYDSHLEDFTLHYWYKHTSPYMQHQFMIELAKAISRSSRLWRLDIQGIWLSEGTLETFLSHLHDSHIRELALSLCRGDVTSQHAEPFSKTEMEALASIPYLDYLKINDTEKLMLETQLREFLNKVVDCQWNQRPLVVVRIDNVHPDRCPLLGCIKRQPSIKNKGNDNHEQRQQQQETTIQLYKNENVSNSRFSVQVDQDYVDSKLKHKFDFPLRDASGYFNRATGEI